MLISKSKRLWTTPTSSRKMSGSCCRISNPPTQSLHKFGYTCSVEVALSSKFVLSLLMKIRVHGSQARRSYMGRLKSAADAANFRCELNAARAVTYWRCHAKSLTKSQILSGPEEHLAVKVPDREVNSQSHAPFPS